MLNKNNIKTNNIKTNYIFILNGKRKQNRKQNK